MKRAPFLYLLLCISLLFMTGCWDRRELNERAFWLATGWDALEEDLVEVSGEIVVPANMQSPSGGGAGGGGGGEGNSGESYFTTSEKGKNAGDVLQKIQSKLSREAFVGQRRVILLGEELAKRGLKNALDINSRRADVGIRTDIFVVKGGKAREVLNLKGLLEKTPTLSALKKHEQVGGRGDTAYLEFLIAANSEGIAPTIPAIEISGPEIDPSKPSIKIAGLAILNRDLQLLGFLDNDGNRDFLLLLGKLKRRTVSVPIDDGSASIGLTKLKSKIVPEIHKDNKIRFKITLSGKGNLFENNTNLNVNHSKNVKFLEKEFEKQMKEQVLQTIQKVQKKYGIDIFGFGEVIHRKHPQQWKTLKKNWDDTFQKAEVSLNVDFAIKHTGLAGPSLLRKESEIKE